jgi:hypothetical protein
VRDITDEVPKASTRFFRPSVVADLLLSKLPEDVEALVRLGHEFTFQAVVPLGGLGYDLTIYVAGYGARELGHANREWSTFHRAMLVLGCGSPTVVKGRTTWFRRARERRRWKQRDGYREFSEGGGCDGND